MSVQWVMSCSQWAAGDQKGAIFPPQASRKRGADAAPAGEDAAKQGRHGGGGGYGQQPAAGGYLPSQYPTAY